MTASCDDVCIAGGGSALITCNPVLTVTELVGWLLFRTEVCTAVPAWQEVLGVTLLSPFRLMPDLPDCIGGLASVTVGPAAWLMG